MPTSKSDIFTLARFGELESFITKFNLEEINMKDANGSSLLHLAITGQKFDIALFLIQSGIDVNIKNSDGQSALHLICVHQDIEVAKKILENGVDVDAKDKYGNNALWTAVFNCKGMNYEMVELLMKHRPDVTTKKQSR